MPGHWEGDLIIGRKNLSAIGTLVERTSSYTMLLHLPDGYTPELVRDALAAKIKTLPEVLRASPDLGPRARDGQVETSRCGRRHRHLPLRPTRPLAAGHRREHHGLLRQYFPKSSDLSLHSADDLDWVAAELNDRPRKRLAFKKPIEQIGPHLLR